MSILSTGIDIGRKVGHEEGLEEGRKEGRLEGIHAIINVLKEHQSYRFRNHSAAM